MFSVVCVLNRLNAPEGVFIFSSPESLRRWMLQVIRNLGVDSHCAADSQANFSDDELIEWFQSSLQLGELFHQFDVFDLRTMKE